MLLNDLFMNQGHDNASQSLTEPHSNPQDVSKSYARRAIKEPEQAPTGNPHID